MKKLIALAMVVVVLSVMLAPPVTATQYDPKHPPWCYLLQNGNTRSGDDSGWQEIDSAAPVFWRLLDFLTQNISPINSFFVISISIDQYPDLNDSGSDPR